MEQSTSAMRRGWESWDCSACRRWGSGDLINVYKYLKGGCEENGVRLFAVMLSVRTRDSGHILEHKTFRLNTRKHCCAVLRCAVEFVESASSAATWTWTWAGGSRCPCLWKGIEPGDLQSFLPISMILWFRDIWELWPQKTLFLCTPWKILMSNHAVSNIFYLGKGHACW